MIKSLTSGRSRRPFRETFGKTGFVLTTLLFCTWLLIASRTFSRPNRIVQAPASAQIPKVAHRTILFAKSDQELHHVLDQSDEMISSFAKFNPDWEVKLWTAENISNAMTDWQKRIYDSLQTKIQRADYARYAILYSQGGVYSDLDIYTRGGLDELIDANMRPEQTCVLLEEATHSDNQLKTWASTPFRQQYFDGSEPAKYQVSNFWMAAAPGHPFIGAVLDEVSARRTFKIGDVNEHILWTSGPGVVSDILTVVEPAIRETIAIITERVWMGHSFCAATESLKINHRLPWCGYLWHQGTGHWKQQPDWCKRDPKRCFLDQIAWVLVALSFMALALVLYVAKRFIQSRGKSRRVVSLWCI